MHERAKVTCLVVAEDGAWSRAVPDLGGLMWESAIASGLSFESATRKPSLRRHSESITEPQALRMFGSGLSMSAFFVDEHGLRHTVRYHGPFFEGHVWNLQWQWGLAFTDERGRAAAQRFAEVVRRIDALSGWCRVSDDEHVFERLGYVLDKSLDYTRTATGYGWLTVLRRSHLELLGEAAVGRLGTPPLAMTKAGDSYVIECSGGPTPSIDAFDLIDDVIEPIRLERRGTSRGGTSEFAMTSLSRLDRALAFSHRAPPMPERHPDPYPGTTTAIQQRNRRWPGPTHRPPLSWYGDEPTA